MAYSNSVESGAPVLAPGSTFLRGLMWAGVAIVVFAVATAFDYTWFSTLAWPIYLVNLGLLGVTLVIGDGIGGAARWVTIGPFQVQFSEIAKILMIIVLANYLARDRAPSTGRGRSSERACSSPRRRCSCCSSRTSGHRSCSAASSPGCCSCPAPACAGWACSPPGSIGSIPIVWTYVLHDYQKQRLLSFIYPSLDPRAPATSCSRHRSRSGRARGSARASRTGRRTRQLPAGPGDRLRVREPRRGARLPRRDRRVRPVHGPPVARPRRGLALADPFGLMSAAGIASMILFQFVVNVGMVIGVMPITGIPLPFVTHGGASLISLAFGLGVLQSINIRQMRAEW